MEYSRIFFLIVVVELVHQQDASRVQHPIGPSFLSIFETKQKIYYNNLGIRIDCLAKGNPLPVLTWFRKVHIDDQLLIPVDSSGLIDLFPNGTLFIRPFRNYSRSIHAGVFVCQAKNAAGSIQSLPIQLKPQIYDAYEIEVKNPYGFIQSSVIITCEISPPIARSYLKIIGWLEQWDNQVIELDLQIKTKYNLLPNQNLIIHNLSKEDDHRNYACLIQNQIDQQIKQSPFKTLRVRDRSPFGPELFVLNNTEYHVRTGDVIELPCGIASLSTNARISWWKNGRKILDFERKIYQNSLIFQVSSSTIDDTGVYTCQVDDEPSGRMTSMMTLIVTVPTECQLLIPQSTIPAGSNSELICTTNIQTSSSIQWKWYHNSLPVFNQENRYSIINATRVHMGMYQCCFLPTISDGNGCCAQTQIRIIDSPPVILSSDTTQIVVSSKNRSQDLNCTIYADPIPFVSIYKNGRKVPLKNPVEYLPTGDVFMHYPILVSTINDTGYYECLAENPLGSSVISKDINLENQRPFIQTLSNATIHSGEIFTLRCYASGQPNLHLQWIDQSTDLAVNTSSTSPILFTSIFTQSNIYTCRARNIFGEISSRIFLTVENPARILYFTPNQTIEINQRLNISCSVDGDFNYEVIFKTPTQTKISTNENHFFIIIDRVQMIDSGFYECYVNNSYSEQRAVSHILVQNHPDQIKNLTLDRTQRLFWSQPFDGNSPILRYILRIQYKQGISWSEEMNINLEEATQTNYSFEHILTKCLISVIIQAVNQIGISPPSDPLYFQTENRKLPLTPYNLNARNISSKSVVLTWEYPSIDICNKSTIRFRIEIIDQYNRTTIRWQSARIITINQLKSFTFYTVMIYAVNDYGSSMKSKILIIQTMEDVPLAMVGNLMARLVNSSSLSISWILPENAHELLHGQFRTFIVSIYENFNMSTLQTIETIHTYLILDDIHSFSRYFITVSICNHFDCGPSSSALDMTTPSLIRSILDSSPIITRTIHRPSSIQAKIHYRTSKEIGLKIIYPSEIIENLIIDYHISNSSFEDQLTISPPLFHIRLMNLSCGHPYDIRIHAKNQIGSSAIEYLHTNTDGSVPIFIESADIFHTITDDHIILNLNQWLIITCPILSYEIEYYPLQNLSQIETNRYLPSIDIIRLDHLQSNTDYQLNIKVSSEAGVNLHGITFRTSNSHGLILRKNQRIIFIMVCIASFLFTFTVVYLILKKIDLFNNRTTRLRPVVYSNKHYRSYSKSSKSRSESFASEDSQGNINPYAVTNCENYQTVIRPSLTRSGRYFRPIILESSSRNQTLIINNQPIDSGVSPSSPPKTLNSHQYSLV